MSFIAELKRRSVFKVGVAYLVGAWILIQVADILLDNIDAPAWVLQIIFVALLVGFFVSLLIAWAFEMTPEGVKRDSEGTSGKSGRAEIHQKSIIAIVALLLAAVAYLLFDKFYLGINGPVSEVAISEISEKEPEDENASKGDTRPSIAVLPFENRSKLEDDAFFVEGVHDDLLTNLARISDLKVISRTTVSQYANTDKTLPVIATELGVDHIMEGAVQRSGDTVRINVQLIYAESDEHIWAEIFDRQLTASNLFSIQSEISTQIASVLKSKLTPEEMERIEDRPTDNLAAYSAYLQGRQQLARSSSSGADQALVEFRRAVELDPDFALAWVGLTSSAVQARWLSDMNHDEARQIITEAATRALELDDQRGEVHLARAAMIGFEKGQWVPEYEEALLRAIELSPGLGETWFIYSQFLSGRNIRREEALAAAQKAVELDPLSATIKNQLIRTLSDLGRFAEAEKRLQSLIQLNPSFAINYQTMSGLKSSQGDYAEALLWQRMAQQHDPGNIMFQYQEVSLLTTLGFEEQYQDLLDRVEHLDPNSSTLAMAESFINLRRGNVDAALEAALFFTRRPDPGKYNASLWKAIIHLFRDEGAKAAAEAQLVWRDNPLSREDFLGMAKDVPQRTCMTAVLIREAIGAELAAEISQAVLDNADQQLPVHERRKLNLSMSICNLVLGDKEGALARLERALEDGQLELWWFPLSLPLFKELEFNPRYEDARKGIESAMDEQRERFLQLSREAGL